VGNYAVKNHNFPDFTLGIENKMPHARKYLKGQCFLFKAFFIEFKLATRHRQRLRFGTFSSIMNKNPGQIFSPTLDTFFMFVEKKSVDQDKEIQSHSLLF
jgi:hypothetical protein